MFKDLVPLKLVPVPPAFELDNCLLVVVSLLGRRLAKLPLIFAPNLRVFPFLSHDFPFLFSFSGSASARIILSRDTGIEGSDSPLFFVVFPFLPFFDFVVFGVKLRKKVGV